MITVCDMESHTTGMIGHEIENWWTPQQQFAISRVALLDTPRRTCHYFISQKNSEFFANVVSVLSALLPPAAGLHSQIFFDERTQQRREISKITLALSRGLLWDLDASFDQQILNIQAMVHGSVSRKYGKRWCYTTNKLDFIFEYLWGHSTLLCS